MNVDKDKILFDVLQKVLHHRQHADIGQVFLECTDDLQRIYPSFSQEQRDIVEAYVHTLADVYVAALAIVLEKMPKNHNQWANEVC